MAERKPVRRALLAVSDKTGIVELARALDVLGVELLSTGGTAAAIAGGGVPVREVSEHTGFPEIMDGRVKTLHPIIHGGILGRRAVDGATMDRHGIAPIDLVVVNLYPFEETTAPGDCTPEEAVENIDIGGPTLLRAAAKNHADVLAVVDPGDYPRVIELLRDGGATLEERRGFAARAFAHTAGYEAAIAAWFAEDGLPDRLTLGFAKRLELRYGENPHQAAAFYAGHRPEPGTVGNLDQLQGKALSYNNIADTDAALCCVQAFEAPACVIVKHANPCGVAVAQDIGAAYEGAFATDPTSAFGGIVAFNRVLDAGTLEAVIGNQFAEVVVAPAVAPAAVEAARKRRNLRLLVVGDPVPGGSRRDFKRVGGGLLVQDEDGLCLDETALRAVARRAPTDAEMADLLFAWKVAWFVKSNAIVYARDGRTVGVGAGQMSRVVSARIASMKAEDAGLAVAGAVMASDAFFPFRDGVDAAAHAGIRAVIQPGGSMRDGECIEAADEHGMAMVFTGVRHFRH